MTTPLSQMPKPEAGQYENNRKLFLVPAFLFSSDTPNEGLELLDRYWSEVRDHVNNLERSLGQVAHVYHEALYADGDEGMSALERLNPKGCSFIRAMVESSATLEATDDQDALEEASDWQRCMSVGLMSQKVASMASEGYQDSIKRRYDHIGARIDETLKEGEAGVLFIREDHRVQFPSDVQVFYVSPPGLDAIKRWIDDQVREMARNLEQASAAPDANDGTEDEPKGT